MRRLLGRVDWWMAVIAVYLLLVVWHYPTAVNGDSFSTWNRRYTVEGYGAPNTSSPFLKFVKNETFFLQIEEMTIRIYTDEEGYYNLTVANYTELMDLPSDMNVDNKSDSDTLIFWKYYIYNANSTFFFNFTFHLEPTSTDLTWYVNSFTHRNLTDSGNCTFEYNGMRRSIYAPSDVSYYCSNMTFHGHCVEGIKSELQLVGLWIQAFSLKDSKPSLSSLSSCMTFDLPSGLGERSYVRRESLETRLTICVVWLVPSYIDCGAKSHNNSIINIVVGSVVGSTLGVAVIVIVVTLIVKMVRVRQRGYSLLDN